jgi:hypothetical protein
MKGTIQQSLAYLGTTGQRTGVKLGQLCMEECDECAQMIFPIRVNLV